MFIVTIFLIASPAFSLVKTHFQTKNNCYSRCYLNYATSLAKLDACKNGSFTCFVSFIFNSFISDCDFELQKKNCADQCKLVSIDVKIQAGCIVGCSMNQPVEKPVLLIRFRHRPLLPLPFFNHDPVNAFNDAITKLREQSKSESIVELLNDIPLINSPNEKNRKIKFKQILIEYEDLFDHPQQLMKYIQKQSKLTVWSFITILILSLAIIVSLCRNKSKEIFH